MANPLVERRATARTKARLDAETIIAAGLQIAARPGATAVTVRELGALLGADPTAIYRHFRSKENLMGALLDRLFAMSLERVTAPREEWRTRLTQLATATIDLFTEYPAIGAEAIVLSTGGPAELEIVELILDGLSVAGLEGEDIVRHYAAQSTYVLSYSAGIARGLSIREGVATEEHRSWMGRSLAVTSATHPQINALREQLLALRDREVFFLGVDALLDAVDATVERRKR